MKKLFTCLGLFALLTVFTAGSALAAFPSALNGTTFKWYGFQMNGTAASTNASVILTPPADDMVQILGDMTTGANISGKGIMNGTVFNLFYQGTDTQKEFLFNNGTGAAGSGTGPYQTWQADQTGPETIPGLLTMSDWNATGDDIATVTVYNGTTNPFYFVPSSDYGLLAGISNSTFNSTHGLFMQIDNFDNGAGPDDDQGGTMTSGINMATLIAGVKPTTSSLAGTWYFYQLGTNASADNYGIARMGSIDFTNNKATYDNNGTTVTAATITDGVIGGGAYATVAGYGELFQNATLDTSGKVMIGSFMNATSDQWQTSFTVLLKDGTVGSAADFKDASYKFVTAGTTSSANATGLLGYFSTDSNGVINEGNATIFVDQVASVWRDFDAAKSEVTYAARTVAGVSQANATFKISSSAAEQGGVTGRFNADKTFFVGIFEAPSGDVSAINTADVRLRHIGFFMPVQATVGTVSVESGTYNNATFAAAMNVSGTTTTALTSTTKATFGLGTTYSALTDMFAFNASINNTADNGAVATFRVNVDNLAISDVSKLKFLKMIEGTNSNSTMAFTYKPSAATTPADGHWWFEDRGTNAYIASNGQLTANGNYYLYYAIKDQTATAGFDRDTAAGSITDPAALFSFSGSTSSSSSDSGCVLNPAAGFGLEWLLLLAAPLLAVLRNKFRK